MSNELISVIVPVYNTEAYLGRCLDSILTQTYTNIEILLINDGSPDSSAAICREYEAKDSRIRYFEKENGGLSDARNYGVERANGEYITFVDSDDWVEETYVEHLYRAAKKHGADIAVANYCIFQDQDAMFYLHVFGDYYEKLFTCQELLMDLPSLEGNDLSYSVVWGKLYHKTMFDFLRFPVGILGEDVALHYKLFLQAEKLVYIHESLYVYRQVDTGITKGSTGKLIADQLSHHAERIVLLALKGHDITQYLERYKWFLEFSISNLEYQNLQETEIYRHIQENLRLIETDY